SPWAEIAAFAERRYAHVRVAFIDVHCAMAMAGARDFAGLDRRVRELQALDASGRLPAGSVGPDFCRALGPFAREAYGQAVQLIEPVLNDLARIGGSRAQRELFEDTLIVACLRDGRLDRAKELLSRRLSRRPSKRDAAWLAQADRSSSN